MRRESHVRICERLGVKFPGPTQQRDVSPTTPAPRARSKMLAVRVNADAFPAQSQAVVVPAANDRS